MQSDVAVLGRPCAIGDYTASRCNPMLMVVVVVGALLCEGVQVVVLLH